MKRLRILFSVGLVVAIAIVAAQLAFAPLWRRYDARQCREAYAAARTHEDSARVDLHPYRGRNGRCGELRMVTVDSVLPGLPRTP